MGETEQNPPDAGGTPPASTSPEGGGAAKAPAPKLPPELSRAAVLSGADELADGRAHVGIAVNLTSGGKPSTLVIADVTKVTAETNAAPVYLTRPISLKFDNLMKFLQSKGVDIPKELGGFMAAIELSCDAFYFSKDGPLLMMFSLANTEGIIKSLTGDDDLGQLFDVNGGSVRIFRCSKDKLPVLQAYAAELAGEPVPAPKLPSGSSEPKVTET